MNKEGSNWETIFREEIRQAGLGCEEVVLRTCAKAPGPDSQVSLGLLDGRARGQRQGEVGGEGEVGRESTLHLNPRGLD